MPYGLIFEFKKYAYYTMSGNKLVKMIMDAATLTGLSTSTGW